MVTECGLSQGKDVTLREASLFKWVPQEGRPVLKCQLSAGPVVGAWGGGGRHVGPAGVWGSLCHPWAEIREETHRSMAGVLMEGFLEGQELQPEFKIMGPVR